MVAAEAMACGTPVIASRVGGVGELVVNDRTGWMVAAGDDKALRERIEWVLGHPGAVRAMRPSRGLRYSPSQVIVAFSTSGFGATKPL